jgi:hypothetical protein
MRAGTERPRRSYHRQMFRIVAFVVLCTVARFASADDRTAHAQAKQLAAAGRHAEACDLLESLILRDPREPERQAAITALLEVLPKAAPSLRDEERRTVENLRRDHPAGTELLPGRYTIVLATPAFAARARQNGLVSYLDLAYVLLRDLFDVDPVRIRGHRYYIFPHATKPGGHTTNSDWLGLMIGRSDWDNADWFERFFHELSHPFINLQPLEHWRCGGFGEGWAEFMQAYVPERLAFLGPPFAGRFAWYVSEFAGCGRREYLDTRLPIEEIVAYGPSSSYLMALLQTTRRGRGPVDWSSFRRMFRDAGRTPPVRYAWGDWPACVARDSLRYFDAAKVRPVLRRYRFPPEVEWERVRPLPPPIRDSEECRKRRADWRAEGVTVIADWQVLGPIPDRNGERLRLDPIDDENFIFRDTHAIDGKTWKWRTDAKIDACGTVYLGELAGGREPCVFYLYAKLPTDASGPLRFWISSDDDCRVWLSGERVHAFWGARGVDVDNADRAFGDAGSGGGWVLAKVANLGGPAGFHLRYAPAVPFAPASERASYMEYLGSRRVPWTFVAPALFDGLQGADAAVRAAAVRALAGRRNEPAVVDAIIRAWTIETDESVEAAVRSGLGELTFENSAATESARRWWERNESAFKDRWYIEAERVYGVDPVEGGYFGNNPGAFGGQCISRGWGNDPAHYFEVVLRASRPGPHTLRIRYTCDDSQPARLRVMIRRGPRAVFEKKDIVVRQTNDRSTWRWLSVPLPSLEPGRYRVEVGVSRPGGAIDVDTIGWQPSAAN